MWILTFQPSLYKSYLQCKIFLGTLKYTLPLCIALSFSVLIPKSLKTLYKTWVSFLSALSGFSRSEMLLSVSKRYEVKLFWIYKYIQPDFVVFSWGTIANTKYKTCFIHLNFIQSSVHSWWGKCTLLTNIRRTPPRKTSSLSS